jgi:DNA-binding IclR family transcriptional regulator
MSGRTSRTIGSTETSFAVVELIGERGEAGVSEVATELGVSKSTAHNHLATLEDLGYVVRGQEGYALGLGFLGLGDRARARYGLYYPAKAQVDELVEAVGERAQVMVEENGRGVYLYQSRADGGIRTDSHVGTAVDLHTTAVGKAYLAFCDPERRDRILSGDLAAKTPNSVTDRESLGSELETIRDRGYAFNDEEKTLGMRAVGAPISSDDGTLLGSLSVSGPTTRMTGDWYREEVPGMVVEAARIIGIKATYS